MINDTPLISVLMTAYNREDFISEAIESVLDSTYKNFELIIVDDGSTDNTVPIAKKFEVIDERIKVYENKTNLGQFSNRNYAATLASGEYIMYVDSDDKIFSDGFERLIKVMN
ncbi:MAG: glycosyltransferase family 2 protein, partial [Ferruginibacter sp.]